MTPILSCRYLTRGGRREHNHSLFHGRVLEPIYHRSEDTCPQLSYCLINEYGVCAKI